MTDMERRAAGVADAFAERAGGRPDGVWVAPGRVNLLGEHTDYNDGFVLPAAIDREAVAAVGRRDDDLVRCWSLQEGEAPSRRVGEIAAGAIEGWSAYVLGVVWALAQAGLPVQGLDIVVDSDVPSGAGLSSSAALECGVALAVAELTGDRDPERTKLAKAARRGETDIVGAPVGVMDQMASLYGQADSAVFLDCRSLEVQQVPLGLAAAGLTLVVLDTRVVHANVDGAYAERRRSCAEAAKELGVVALRDATPADVVAAADRLGPLLARRARHVVTEDERVLQAVELLRAGRVDGLGGLFAASHASMRDDFEISVPQLDTAVAAALDGGAVAARMTGGGFGGAAVAVAPVDAVSRIGERAHAAFAERGYQAPDVFAVTASDGARRLA